MNNRILYSAGTFFVAVSSVMGFILGHTEVAIATIGIFLFVGFSYGIYIYAFPIQQFIGKFLFPRLTVFTYFVLSFICSLIVAILSWYFIEKPMLALKHREHKMNKPLKSGMDAV